MTSEEEVISVVESRPGWFLVTLASVRVMVPAETTLTHNLQAGGSIDSALLLREARLAQAPDARKYINRYLASADRSSGQLRKKLRERGYLPEVVGESLSWAMEYGLLDDLRYARAYASGRMLGKTGLKARLIQRGVDESAVSAVLSDLREEESVDILVEMVARKYGSIPDTKAARRRAAGWLSRRGYSPDIVAAVIGRAL